MRRVSRTARVTLKGADTPLTDRYDVALLDLDGVVYVGEQAVDGVPRALAEVRRRGMRLAFVTNNAARPPLAVAQRLNALGVPAGPADVITSAQAAAHYLADRLPQHAKVLVVGTVGLDEALTERGLAPVHEDENSVAAVVQGYSPSLDWKQLAEGAVAIRRGVPWVATNLDATVPSPRGPLPGNGSMVAALRQATGLDPVVTGKPDPTMHRESVQRSGAKRPLVVGDRLDTDIEGATAAGCPSMVVLSGVTVPYDLIGAGREFRPSFLAHDARGLLESHAAPTVQAGEARCGSWQAAHESGNVLRLSRLGTAKTSGASAQGGFAGEDPTVSGEDGLDALRALCTAAWDVAAPRRERARKGEEVGFHFTCADAPSEAALQSLGLR
ncbi:MAG: HAD-IIA family hydrolase [Jatrophihabitantaceae bacterium]